MKTTLHPNPPLPRLKFAFYTCTILILHTTYHHAAAAAGTNTATAARSETLGIAPPFIAPAIPQSDFQQPKKLTEGRNPFFPQSTKHITGFAPIDKGTNVHVTPVPELALKGISGTPEQPLAIINNRTLALGEEAEITMGAGKIRIRCSEINSAEGTVTVQVGGQSRVLRLPTK